MGIIATAAAVAAIFVGAADAAPSMDAALSELMGTDITVTHGKVDAGRAVYAERRVVLSEGYYAAVKRGPAAARFYLGMGILAHELGHLADPLAGYVPNGQGGYTGNRKANEDAADRWAYANMGRVFAALGHVGAAKAVRAFKKFRDEHPY